MDEKDIRAAINRAEKGVLRYLAIMDLFPKVDVSVDCDFQRQFNAFYRVRQRPREWYEVYFSFLQESKTAPVPFEVVLDYLQQSLGRYEPSFSSKLAATLDPNEPVWDSFVLKNTHQTAPSYTSKKKFDRAKEVFKTIRAWYATKLASEHGRLIVSIFDEMVKEHKKITDLKKIDFVLWQTRA